MLARSGSISSFGGLTDTRQRIFVRVSNNSAS